MLADEIVLPLSYAEQKLEQAKLLNDYAGNLYKAGMHPGTALIALRRALALAPHEAAVWANLGLELWVDNDIENARAALKRAAELEPGNHSHHGNLGVFSSSVGDGETAERHLKEAMRLNPDSYGPKWDHALLQLWRGNWDKGLAEYDVRRPHRGPELYPGMPYPLWQGEDLDGKSIYIQGEQGVGDRILFSRYIAWLHERWPTCKIYACMNDELVPLLWEFRPFVEFLWQGIPWPKPVDYACFLLTLPQFHGSRPDFVPPDPGLIRKRITSDGVKCNLPEPRLPSVKVAICWTGNPTQTRNVERTIPLELMLTLAEDPRIALYGVQCGAGQVDVARLGAEELMQNLGPGIEKEGWVGTGLVLQQMDVIVTVCTAVAHLAGALGLNCWTLLCRDPYWVWPRKGTTTPWYPEMRLFRQQASGDWRPVIAEVRSELTTLADARLGPV